MSQVRNKLFRLFTALPVIILVTLINVFITFTTSGVVLIQLLAGGYNKYLSLGVATLVAIGVHTYIVFNHKIRDYINRQDQGATQDE
jgi:succinate dehydrogenase hydrophobic anchor subunit